MGAIVLKEYAFNDSTRLYEYSNFDFTFSPKPETLNKTVQLEWKVYGSGWKVRRAKARCKVRETITWKLTGKLALEECRKLEWMSKRHSKYAFYSDILTPDARTDVGDESNWSDTTPPNEEDTMIEEENKVYVIIDSVSFDQSELWKIKYKGVMVEALEYTMVLKKCRLVDSSFSW